MSIYWKLKKLLKNENFLIVGGLDGFLDEKEKIRDVDIVSLLNRNLTINMIKYYFILNKIDFIYFNNPYGLDQFFFWDKNSPSQIGLLDVLYLDTFSLRIKNLIPINYFLIEKIEINDLYVNSILFFIKNIYKAKICKQTDKYNKFLSKKIINSDNIKIKNFKSYIIIFDKKTKNFFIYRKNFLKGILNGILTKMKLIYITNILNIVFLPSNVNFIKDFKLYEDDQIDLRIIKGFKILKQFKRKRKFLGIEIPVSELKITVIIYPAFISNRFFGKKNIIKIINYLIKRNIK